MEGTFSQRKVDLDGALCVDCAAALKLRLLAELEVPGDLILDISAVEDLDLACLQVFYAAAKSAKSAGKRIGFYGQVAPKVANRLAACGFLRERVERADEFAMAMLDF